MKQSIKIISVSLITLILFGGCNLIYDDSVDNNDSLIYSGPINDMTNLDHFKKTGESINN